MIKCNICSGTLRKEKINIARYWGKDIIALNDVPALICQKCGERYFDAKVSAKIDQKIHQALKQKTKVQQISVPVVQF